jgi:hypothetical protein
MKLLHRVGITSKIRIRTPEDPVDSSIESKTVGTSDLDPSRAVEGNI